MAVKMGYEKSESRQCSSCGCTIKSAKEMYKFRVESDRTGKGGDFCLCDECANIMLSKILKAQVAFNERVKSQEEIAKFNRIKAEREKKNGRGILV